MKTALKKVSKYPFEGYSLDGIDYRICHFGEPIINDGFFSGYKRDFSMGEVTEKFINGAWEDVPELPNALKNNIVIALSPNFDENQKALRGLTVIKPSKELRTVREILDFTSNCMQKT